MPNLKVGGMTIEDADGCVAINQPPFSHAGDTMFIDDEDFPALAEWLKQRQRLIDAAAAAETDA